MITTGIQRILKKGELAVRRTFISLLSKRSSRSTDTRPLPLSQSPKIVLLRQDRLGDAIISTPLLVALKNTYPKAEMMMLLGENNKGIIPLLPIECETFIYRKNLFSDLRMLRAIRNRKVDVLIDLQDNASATSSILTAAIGAKYSIGIDKENASSYNVLVHRLDQSKYHVSRRIAELLTPFGIDPDSLSLCPVLKDTTSTRIHGRVGVVYSAGAVDRYLPVSKNVEIVNAITQTGTAKEIVIFSQPKDNIYAKEIAASANSPRISTAPVTNSFLEYASLLCTCSIVITPDTSAVHLCSAYKIPVVMIAKTFPPTLHYWTPIDVAYRMITKDDLSCIEVSEVIRSYSELHTSLGVDSQQLQEVSQ